MDVSYSVYGIAPNVKLLHGVCRAERLKYEVEYGLKRGTSDNSYLITVRAHSSCLGGSSRTQSNTYVNYLIKVRARNSCPGGLTVVRTAGHPGQGDRPALARVDSPGRPTRAVSCPWSKAATAFQHRTSHPRISNPLPQRHDPTCFTAYARDLPSSAPPPRSPPMPRCWWMCPTRRSPSSSVSTAQSSGPGSGWGWVGGGEGGRAA